MDSRTGPRLGLDWAPSRASAGPLLDLCLLGLRLGLLGPLLGLLLRLLGLLLCLLVDLLGLRLDVSWSSVAPLTDPCWTSTGPHRGLRLDLFCALSNLQRL